MMREPYQQVEEKLAGLLPGRFERVTDGRAEAIFRGQTEGRGRFFSRGVMPGVSVIRTVIIADRACLQHEPRATSLEITHCRYGRTGWTMRGGGVVYLGEGDVTIQNMTQCADSMMHLPLGFFEGVSVMLDLEALAAECPALLREAGFDSREIRAKFREELTPLTLPASPELEGIFGGLYDAEGPVGAALEKLKAQELLLYLMGFDPAELPAVTPYLAEQTELVREIRQFLLERLDRRYTIEELSKLYLINTSSLKEIFKAVYGQPIATYMKSCRLNEARRLLRETDLSLGEIAERIGYRTQGKFTQAFKEFFAMLPSDYRRETRG